jgi:uncharacterized protein (TIGR03437 family)
VQTRFLGRLFSVGACIPNYCLAGTPAAEITVTSAIDAVDVDSAGRVYTIMAVSSGTRVLLTVTPGGILEADGMYTTARDVVVDSSDRAHIVYEAWTIVGPDGEADTNSGYSAFVQAPTALAIADDGTVYATSTLSRAFRMARLTPDLIYDVIIGTGEVGFSGDGGPARDAQLASVAGSLWTSDDTLYIADRRNHRIRRVNRVSECPSGGSLLSIFGVRLGPSELTVATLDSSNRLPTELAGTRVLFDGVPVPILFVSAGQLAAVIPYSAEVNTEIDERGGLSYIGDFPPLTIETAAGRSDERELGIYPARPGIFTLDGSGTGPAAALNQDGSLNTRENPARPGEIVVLWATGFGAVEPTPVDGEVLTGELPQPLTAVEVFIDDEPTEVFYGAAAPGMVAGVMQVNLRVPSNLTSGKQDRALSIVMANARSRSGVTIWAVE